MTFPLLPRRNILSPLYTRLFNSGTTPTDVTSNEKELGWTKNASQNINGNSRICVSKTSSDLNLISSNGKRTLDANDSNFTDDFVKISSDSEHEQNDPKTAQASAKPPPQKRQRILNTPFSSTSEVDSTDLSYSADNLLYLSPVKASQSSMIVPSPTPISQRNRIVASRINTIVFEFGFNLDWTEKDYQAGHNQLILNRSIDIDTISVWEKNEHESNHEVLEISIYNDASRPVILLQDLEKLLGYVAGRQISRMYKRHLRTTLETKGLMQHIDISPTIVAASSPSKASSQTSNGKPVPSVEWKEIKMLLYDIFKADNIIVVFM